MSMDDAVKEAAQGKTAHLEVDSLLNAYESKADEIVVELPMGEQLRFRPVNDHSEYQKIKVRIAKLCERILSDKMPQPWKDRYQVFVPKASPATLGYACFLAEVAIDPKWDVGDWLKIARRMGTLFDDIFSSYEKQNSPAMRMAEIAAIERLGEESETMGSGEQSSPSQEMSSENTRTN